MKSRYYKAGVEAKTMPPEQQNMHKASFEKSLKADIEKNIEKCGLKGAIKNNEIENINREIKASGPFTKSQHQQNLILAALLLIMALVGLGGESILVFLTLQVFQFGVTERVLSISIIVFGFLSFEIFLSQLEKSNPEMYQKFNLYSGFLGLIAFFAGIILLADVRGDLFNSKFLMDASSLESQIETGEKLMESSGKNLTSLMVLFAVVGASSCGIVLHSSLRRFTASIVMLAKYHKVNKLSRKRLRLAAELKVLETLFDRAVSEYEMGFNSKDKNTNWESILISPLAMVLYIVLLLLLITKTAKGAEPESVFVLFDISKSSLSENYKAEDEFKKNVRFIEQIIKGLKSGSELKVIGITANSFSVPYIILEGRMPADGGLFNKDIAKAKLALIKEWKSIGIKAESNATDIFGAVCLASFLFRSSGMKKLIVISDMRECVNFNFETTGKIDLKIMDKVRAKGLIPSLKGVDVYVLGVHTCGKNEAYYISLKEFWIEYFVKQAGANLKKYSMERSLE